MNRLFQSIWLARRSPLAVNAVIALCALLLFHAVSMASGKLTETQGLGWDGEVYARMVTGALADGTTNTQTRSLLVLAARIPHALGMSVINSFQLMNYLSAWGLYFVAALLLERYGAPTAARAVIVGNLALCVATSKMFGFYPVLVDLAALALITLAFHLIATDRRWLAGIACVLATASREFGIAAPIYGIHRALRRGRPWSEAALTYLPSVATMLLVRWWVITTNVGDARADGPLSVGDAMANLAYWRSPAFAGAFAYFIVIVFGGISALLVARGRWSLARLRDEPELATFLAVIVGAAAVGSLDIWRYLAFALPVALVLIAQYWRGWDAPSTRRWLVLMTLVTVVTQQPFAHMDRVLYFREWFPLYPYFEARSTWDGLVPVWGFRAVALALLMTAIAVTARQERRLVD